MINIRTKYNIRLRDDYTCIGNKDVQPHVYICIHDNLIMFILIILIDKTLTFIVSFVFFYHIEQGWANSALRGKLSSETVFRADVRLSSVTVKSDYAILALRNYKIQAENLYSYLIIVKLLTSFRSLKHSDSLEM